jgi:hypothetical protein
MRHSWFSTLVVCGFIALSQHGGAEGMWLRVEKGPMPEAECRALLKKITTRAKVGFTKWYDVTPQMLEKEFGTPATPDRGTWLACWPDGTVPVMGEPDS